MVIEAAVVSTAIRSVSELRKWLARKKEGEEDLKGREQEAVAKLLRALTETDIHIGHSFKTASEEKASEEGLAKLWTSTAIAFMGVDSGLASRAQLKSGAWARPDLWSDSRLRNEGVDIDSMRAIAQELLGGLRS